MSWQTNDSKDDKYFKSYYIKHERAIQMNGLIFFIFTLIYFVIEIIINYQLYKQLSFSSNFFTVSALEFWGKTIAGIGLALVLTRFYFTSRLAYLDNNGPMRIIPFFIFCLIISIPSSFWLQNTIIEKLVDSSTDEQRNKAVLILATKTSLVPHYSFDNASYPTDDLEMGMFDKIVYPFRAKESAASEQYIKNEAVFMSVAHQCVINNEVALDSANFTDKAFFALGALKAENKESYYKSIIKNYYTCLYENDGYLDAHTGEIERPSGDIVKDMYENHYLPADEKYRKYYRLAARTGKFSTLDREWYKEMDKFFGFRSSLPPLLEFYQFRIMKDVKRYYLQQAGEDAIYPYGNDLKAGMRKILAEKLPNVIIENYINEDGSLNYDLLNATKNEEKFESDGKNAYKSIVMPIVGLGMSAFFLVFNIIMALYALAKIKFSKPVAYLILIFSCSWFILYPHISLNQKYSDRDFLSDQSLMVEWLYYHERNIGWIYSLVLD